METISHDGTVFTKATVLAKKYRYTTDYIGQLCRAGKVESKLIGRAWFVSEEALLKHKTDRYSVTRLPEIIINSRLVSEKSPSLSVSRSILPVLSKTTHRSLPTEQHLVIHHDKNSSTRIATYHQDFGALEPTTHAKTLVTKIPKAITQVAEVSKNIPIILGEKAKHTLTFEPLPEVSLQGNLAIQSLDDPDLFTDTMPVSVAEINFTPESVKKTAEIVTKLPVRLTKTTSVPIKHIPKKLTVPFVVPKQLGTPNVVLKHEIKVEKVLPAVPSTRVNFFTIPGFVLGAIILCVGLLSLSSFVESDGVEFRESLKFNLASVSAAVEKLPKSY